MPTVTEEEIRLVEKAKDVVNENETLKKDNERMKKALAKKDALTPARERTVPGANDAPAVSVGGYNRNSQGFSLAKALAAKLGYLAESEAKEDLYALDQFHKSLGDTGNRLSTLSPDQHSIKIPLDTNMLPPAVHQHEGFKVFKAMEAAGLSRQDPDKSVWVLKKADMSYLTDSIGGELLAPPQMGQLIDLIRPKEAFLAAGATTVPLPPNGRITYPRQTGATTAYWVGENTSITASNPTFGQVALQAKKLGDFVVLSNELLKYAGVAVDTIIRQDMAKTLALALDYACFYGSGSAAQPKGLTLYTGTNEVLDYAGQSPTPKGIGTNGNTLRPEDGYRMVGLLEDRNFEFEGWIARPSLANNIMGFRADAAAPADAAGAFVQSMMRAITDKMPGDSWSGYKMTKSAVVKNTNTKGSASNLTELFGGQWSHWLIGMYGAVELATSTQAGSLFQQDQTAIRALMHCDAVPRYEGAFVWYKQLVNSTN